MPDSPVLTACPVCTWPQPDVATCPRCGTALRGDYVAGLPTPADQRAYAERLRAQQRRYDLRAAVLAAAVPGGHDPVLLNRMLGFCRGGAASAPSPAETDEPAAGPRRPPAEGAVGIGFPLARLVAGETAAIHFVEIGPDGVAVETLVGAPGGVPRRVPGPARHWHDLVPGLPRDDEALRRFRLAGGVGTGASGDPATLARAVPDAAARAARMLLGAASAEVDADAGARAWGMPAASGDCVLVLRTLGWPSLEDAARGVRAAAGPVAEIVDLSEDTLPQVVGGIARRAPLRHEYALALGTRGPRGTVALDPFPLFRAGSAVQQHDVPHAQLDVRAVFPGVSRLLLPVLARMGAEQADWTEVGRAIVDARGGASVTVRVRLDGPGAVTFRAPVPLAEDESLPRWPDLRRNLPYRAPGGMAADLVVLVEVGGAADLARARLDLLDRLLDAAPRADLRVAVVGYRDHNVEAARPVSGSMLETAGQARAWSAGLRAWEPDREGPDRFGDDNAAPLEDALDWVATQDMGWRSQARHLLLTIGRRPPHPPEVDNRARPQTLRCQNGIDWEKTLVTLRQRQDAECFAVVPAVSGVRDEETDRMWRMLGAADRIDMETASAERLVRAMDLVAGAGPRWCLAERADGPR